MESENESLQDHDMSSNASSSRASTPSIPEHFHSACLRRKLIEQELKTYTDSIDHTEILMKNLERQGLLDHPIYTNHRTMIHGLRRQRDLLSVNSTLMRAANRSIAVTHSAANLNTRFQPLLLSKFFDHQFSISSNKVPLLYNRWRQISNKL
ncbi:hypothetical protein NPIL_264141 [Nephila pilipes]|uniref:Uncharacterized protein n=2 Tax=Nephila pilipes TaxID=299642 RepID=A0A8X6MQG4_NEPPI|nr:hypothetical protein NPIL_264141 [Nephila pilipes]